jgi:GNAT superfamily N-acetyltransferase
VADSHVRGGSFAVSVRPATDADCEVIARLAGELGYPVGAESVCARLSRLPAGDAVLVAEAKPAVETGGHASGGGHVLGWVHASASRSLLVDDHLQILGLVVGSEWRGRGVGTRLMEAAEGWAAERGLRLARVRSGTQRIEAHTFYQGLGYRETKTQRVFVKDLS